MDSLFLSVFIREIREPKTISWFLGSAKYSAYPHF